MGPAFWTQTPETQALFIATWGTRAQEVWANQHNAELVAAGYPIPQPQVAAAPVQGQSGAQVSDDNDSNGNDDDSKDNDDDN